MIVGVCRLIANHFHLAFFESTPEVRVLPSTGITRLQRSYDPVRLPPMRPPEATLRPLPSHRTGLPRLLEPPFPRAEPTTPAGRQRCGGHGQILVIDKHAYARTYVHILRCQGGRNRRSRLRRFGTPMRSPRHRCFSQPATRAAARASSRSSFWFRASLVPPLMLSVGERSSACEPCRLQVAQQPIAPHRLLPEAHDRTRPSASARDR
jgi:hypothetical protein